MTKKESMYMCFKNPQTGNCLHAKKNINIGEAFGEMVEVKTGLSAGEQLITEGYQDLYEGQQVITASN